MLTIITPTHKKSSLFDLTVESVMQQTCKDFEWLVLDNSKDFYFKAEFERFKSEHPEYDDTYKNVRIVEEKYDGVYPVAFYKNRCVELTTCSDNDFILVFDHDDLMFKTTVEDFVGCINKYGDSVDYITGDGICLNYNENNDGMFRPTTEFNIHTTTPKVNPDDLVIGKNFTLSLNKGGIEIPQIHTFDYSVYDFMVGSHPRAIRKRFLKHDVFKFYEKSRLEEDTMQVILAPMLLNVGWIDRGTVVYVVYYGKGYTNSCNERTEQDYLEHSELGRGTTLIFEGFRKLYKGSTCGRMIHYNDFKK